ncbi:MAG: DUF3093 domain-containing protein [Jatrophihabitans sp.]|nr:MAG: DUF3093 domain-containing protein [Jatrophihabitans sp.]
MSAGRETPSRDGVLYRERLRTPWWWYLVGLLVASLLAAEFRVAGYHLTIWIPFVTLLPLSVVIVWWFGHAMLEISGGEVRVRGAHLPLCYVSGVVALDAATLRRVVGREGDPSAFISIRPWIGPGVQLWLDDPDDPTPYWLLSTRRPRQLAEIIRGEI